MTKKELIWALTGILLFAALAEAIWLYEIAVKVGWVSLAWLKTGLVYRILFVFALQQLILCLLWSNINNWTVALF